jgi:hypothetical protein
MKSMSDADEFKLDHWWFVIATPWARGSVAREGDVDDDWFLAEPLRTVASARYRGTDRGTDSSKHPLGTAGAG